MALMYIDGLLTLKRVVGKDWYPDYAAQWKDLR